MPAGFRPTKLPEDREARLRLGFRDLRGLDRWFTAELFPPWKKRRPKRAGVRVDR